MEDLGIFYGHLVYIFYGYLVYLIGHLVYFMRTWLSFPVLVFCNKKNLATLHIHGGIRSHDPSILNLCIRLQSILRGRRLCTYITKPIDNIDLCDRIGQSF
jgi:hypothetical protein